MHVDAAVGEMLREVGDVLDLAVGEPACAELSSFSCKNRLWFDRGAASDNPIPDALSRLDGNLLAANGACEREKRLAARRHEDTRVRAHDRSHDRVLSGQGPLCPIPVAWLHSEAVRLHEPADSEAGFAVSSSLRRRRSPIARGT